MNYEEAATILREAKRRFPNGSAYFCYQEVADALSALPDIDMPNPMFARSDVDFEGEPVYIFKRGGKECFHGDPAKMYMGWDAERNCPKPLGNQ